MSVRVRVCPWLILSAMALVLVTVPEAKCAVSPSQVLVLYNADWKKDAPLTAPGQDSKEIAEHYVYMHTDPKTGEKPYILGLTCVHPARNLGKSHLNSIHLSEQSHDNANGVMLTHNGHPLLLQRSKNMRDSRALEFIFPKSKNKAWRFETLEIRLLQHHKTAALLVENGQSQQGNRVAVQRQGQWNVRANARSFLTGSFTAEASCQDVTGKLHRWEADYTDFLDVAPSKTGPDRVRDDQHYLDDVENQVKAFLEDPKNARKDGTLLKDYILFIVISYGLPKTAVAPYGIARGITEDLNNYGSIISLDQRIELMDYSLDAVMGTAPEPHRFRGKNPFTAYYFRSPQAEPLFGAGANPFMHPSLYARTKGDFDTLVDPVPFTIEERKRFPDRHLFFVMRIDAPTAMAARALIDRAVYASKYGGPRMGQIPGKAYAKSENRVGKLSHSAIGNWLWDKGYRQLYYGGAARNRIAFLQLSPNDGFFNQKPVYLPGGIGETVISHNGWKNGEVLKDLEMGVTITAGAGRVYNGAPHIHNKSWWDDNILYPFLLKGRTIGEALLMNQAHLGWITTFVGDPLYRLPISEIKDEAAPQFNPARDVKFWVQKEPNGEKEVWIVIDLRSSPSSPEIAQMRAISSDGSEALCQTFESRPYAKLGTLKNVCSHAWRVELIDPFGHRFSARVPLDCANSL
jgi:hypothetical protein